MMHQRSWKTLIAGGAALALGVTLTAFGAPTHAAGVPGIASAARAQDEVMNYAVNLAADASHYDFNAAVSKASENGVVLAQYPEFNTFFVQSVKAAFAPTLGKSLVDAGISYQSIGPTRYKTVTGSEVRTEQPQTTASEANAVADAAGTRSIGLSADSQLNDFTPDEGDANAWGLAAVGALDAQQVDVPLEKVTVGVMDTGIDPDHKDLKEHLDASRSVGCQINGIPSQNPADWKDDHYHGTHVAGTIAAAHNAYGVDAVAPSATIVAIKTSNEAGSLYPEYVAWAFDWAAEHDIDVTNSSYYMDPYAFWMPTEGSQAAGLEAASRAICYAKNHGVVNIAAEGNDNDDHDNPTIDKASPNDVEVPRSSATWSAASTCPPWLTTRSSPWPPSPCPPAPTLPPRRSSVPSSPTTARTPLTWPPPARASGRLCRPGRRTRPSATCPAPRWPLRTPRALPR